MKQIFQIGLLTSASVMSTVLYSADKYPAEIPGILPPGIVAKPEVRLLSLGGTITGTATERLNITNYGAPRLDPEDWVNALPELALFAQVTAEDIRPEGVLAEKKPGDKKEPVMESGVIDTAHWMKVARRLQELANDPTVDGIVVTHGTNTMVETGFFMNLTVDTHKPIVFVGSQRPWTALSGDGPLNMVNAIRVAASPEAAEKGVLHVMNQNINAMRDVNKSSAYRMQTFQSIDLGVMGVADPDIVKFYTAPTRKHTYQSAFNILTLPKTLPDVEIVYGYHQTPAYLVDAMVANGVKGIVVDGTGAGSVPRSLREAIEKAQAAGVVIVATARTRGGRVQDTPRRSEAKIVPGDNFTPEKARILLQLALTKTTDVAEIQQIFGTY